MEWELEWILGNLDQYQSHEHANAVIQNIKKRYIIQEMRSLIDEYECKFELYEKRILKV